MSQESKEWVVKSLGDDLFKNEGVCWCTPEGIIIGANQKFLDLYNYQKEDILGLFYVLPGFECNSTEYWKAMSDALAAVGEYSEVFCYYTDSDGVRYSEIWAKKTYNGLVFIHKDITKYQKEIEVLKKKCVYLEHASKIMRHDMHAGINTYVPRGISSLERRLDSKQIHDLKIEAPLKMIKEGLEHAQKVYRGVYEFTNLVKEGGKICKSECDLSFILKEFLSSTAYSHQVHIEDLGVCVVNEPLFCTALDNIIRNGLKYNDSDNKKVTVKRVDSEIWVEDNGRGMSPEEFKELSKPYSRKKDQKEAGTGLGLDIFLAIMKEHDFKVRCELVPTGGTRIKITLK
jgi:signal transduction histidine kinase